MFANNIVKSVIDISHIISLILLTHVSSKKAYISFIGYRAEFGPEITHPPLNTIVWLCLGLCLFGLRTIIGTQHGWQGIIMTSVPKNKA